MPQEFRYSIERVKDSLWIVVDKARQGSPIGRSGDERGARKIVALLLSIRSASCGGKADGQG